MKYLVAATLLAMAVCARPGFAQPNSPDSIIYNQAGNEVGVIQRQTPDGNFILLPTAGTLGLGYYDIRLPAAALRHRAQGGWVTSLNNEQLAFLPPSTDRYWQPSGD